MNKIKYFAIRKHPLFTPQTRHPIDEPNVGRGSHTRTRSADRRAPTPPRDPHTSEVARMMPEMRPHSWLPRLRKASRATSRPLCWPAASSCWLSCSSSSCRAYRLRRRPWPSSRRSRSCSACFRRCCSASHSFRLRIYRKGCESPSLRGSWPPLSNPEASAGCLRSQTDPEQERAARGQSHRGKKGARSSTAGCQD